MYRSKRVLFKYNIFCLDDHSNRGYAGTRTYHGSQKIHSSQDYRRPHEPSHDHKKQTDDKQPLSPTEDRTITTSDKNIKVTIGHGTQMKGPLMSVKGLLFHFLL